MASVTPLKAPHPKNASRGLLYALGACSGTLVVTVSALSQDAVSRSSFVPILGLMAFLDMIGCLLLAPTALYRLLRDPGLRSTQPKPTFVGVPQVDRGCRTALACARTYRTAQTPSVNRARERGLHECIALS
jgi:hypothetical protein